MDSSNSRKREIITMLSVLIVIVVIVGAVVVMNKKDSDDTGTNQTPSTSTSENGTQTNNTYKDGSYTATGSYQSPGGQEEIDITVTLKDGVITDTSANGKPSGATATEYQGKFISGYKDQVVGKAIDSVSLDRVSGSSLTPKGFNDAIEQIKQEAVQS